MVRKKERVSVGLNGLGAAQHSCGGALDGSQRPSQLVAHHGEELIAHALHLLQGRHVLDYGDGGYDASVIRVDRRRIDEDGQRPPVGAIQQDLFRPHDLAATQRPRKRTLIVFILLPVRPPVDRQLVIAHECRARFRGHAEDALGLLVDGREGPRAGVDHHDAHGRRLHKRRQSTLLRLCREEARPQRFDLPAELVGFLQGSFRTVRFVVCLYPQTTVGIVPRIFTK